jgi:uncharacterized damage-inducible protein DinB
MTPQDLIELFEYDRWATDRVLDAAQGARSAFLEEKGPSVGAARELMVHVGDAQMNWVRRLKGGQSDRQPFDRLASVDEVRTHCHTANAVVREYLGSLAQADFEREVPYVAADGSHHRNTPREILLQVFTHGVHHRAEVADLLSRAGFVPEPVELLHYFRARR